MGHDVNETIKGKLAGHNCSSELIMLVHLVVPKKLPGRKVTKKNKNFWAFSASC